MKTAAEFEDGHTVWTGQEFVDKVYTEYIESIKKDQEWGWKTNYAFSVYPEGSDDPKATNQNGEWVNAHFLAMMELISNGIRLSMVSLKCGTKLKENKHVIPED